MKGNYEEAKGAVKKKVGRVIDDKEMKRKGAAERQTRNVREQGREDQAQGQRGNRGHGKVRAQVDMAS